MTDARNWRDAYKEVLNESPNGHLIAALHAAEAAIFLRSQELDGQGDDAEREEMRAASADLLAIKVHKLGWPNPWTTNSPRRHIHPQIGLGTGDRELNSSGQ
jgi:hypothetical protein